MVAIHSYGLDFKTKSKHGISRTFLVVIPVLFFFCLQAGNRDTITTPSDTNKSVNVQTHTSPTNAQFEKDIIQSIRRLENKDTILTELNRVVRNVLPSSLASDFIYLIKLAHQSDVLFALLILIFYFFSLSLFMGIYLLITKIKSNYQERKRIKLEKRYHDIIAAFLFQESDDQSIPPSLINQHSFFRKNILINLMVRLYIDLEGDVAQKLHYLYIKLGLDRVSLRKIKHGKWSVKIQGFRELSNMDVEEAIASIRKYTNHHNEELRSEAMIAMVRLDKKNPFGFLDELTSPFTKWEQLNVFSIARKYRVEIPSFKKWFYHKNITVVRFALNMVGVFQQFDATDDIIKMLRHRDPEIRKLSIKLIGEFRLFNQESFLRARYPQESEENKLEIIQALSKIPDFSQINFFREILLRSSSHPICVAVSKALFDHSPEGKATFDLIRGKNQQKFDPVYHHIIDKRI